VATRTCCDSGGRSLIHLPREDTEDRGKILGFANVVCFVMPSATRFWGVRRWIAYTKSADQASLHHGGHSQALDCMYIHAYMQQAPWGLRTVSGSLAEFTHSTFEISSCGLRFEDDVSTVPGLPPPSSRPSGALWRSGLVSWRIVNDVIGLLAP
jgi:hypothetical protein